MKAHPENAAFDWLLAVECRNYNRNEEGVRAYEALGKHFKTGPSLFHQTYANLLDELGRSEEALPHRKLAVQLEPASWSFGGLAHTCVQLGRPADAADAYDQWLKLQPGSVAAWRGSATQRLLAKQPDKAVDAAHHWVDLQPKSAAAYALLGRSLAANRKISEAADAYKQAATLEPSNDNYASTAILLLHKAGRSAEAAREIKALIDTSVERASQGAALADRAGATMAGIVEAIRRVTELIGAISAASTEQNAGVGQVGAAVTQMDGVTQQNAALVGELSAAASELKAQAEELVQAMAVFKLRAASAAPGLPPSALGAPLLQA